MTPEMGPPQRKSGGRQEGTAVQPESLCPLHPGSALTACMTLRQKT